MHGIPFSGSGASPAAALQSERRYQSAPTITR